MKKLNTLTIAALVSGPFLFQAPVSAQSIAPVNLPVMPIAENVQQQDVSNFMKVSGVISKVIKDDANLPKLIVEDKEKTTETHLNITDEALIFNSSTTEQLKRDSLKEGLLIDAYYDKHKPMLMIYPPRITPEIVIVNDKEKPGNVKVGLFDENLVSLDNDLKLNIGEKTVILNEKGENISAEELKGKELIVFYTVSTKSIPAQTTPTKIIVLDIAQKHMLEEAQFAIGDDYYMEKGEKMIPIRKVAEHFGYKVEWQNESATIEIRQQNRSFLISIGKEQYSYNKSLRYFKVVPEIKNGKAYVPEEILDILGAN
ncbi:copper amine oxidase family protein [Schinkia azotoformans MEV2011]|uniref:Copper amine oxidase family protein n=1 Tax=Schinkia azotoformans MEV2011 TaxID=1348973 RepID=A0A072NZX4_SCHAZ|nr:copper amine oxidase N-terminal domain-containing protein [Schinkia azotoformans]KEF38795.1 copper amine oxidase family protein [Schinkia azotoformans MEV2011]MEC1693954.1 copper amine oxidase N-terminal domain-containing protein [Schinkia azotoformans]MEC1714222.1 copper amine oxidase N-terminal domain-containing protein [Schinkia azotoformans]MEC1724585.1 copper amine oxidase N-terminal domain-containing protein [Schinkia azotoformans]MEC1742437.1 copper amine oxidase N-terminal domain-co